MLRCIEVYDARAIDGIRRLVIVEAPPEPL